MFGTESVDVGPLQEGKGARGIGYPGSFETACTFVALLLTVRVGREGWGRGGGGGGGGEVISLRILLLGDVWWQLVARSLVSVADGRPVGCWVVLWLVVVFASAAATPEVSYW